MPAFPSVTTTSDSNASAAFVSTCAAAGLNVNGLNGLAQLQLAVANLLSSSPPVGVTVPASQVTAGTFGAGAYTFPSTLAITGLLTASAGVTIPAAQTLTFGAAAVVAGTPVWSSSQAITLSTAAQPNVTSVGTLTALDVSMAGASPTITIKATSNTTLFLDLWTNGAIRGRIRSSTAATALLSMDATPLLFAVNNVEYLRVCYDALPANSSTGNLLLTSSSAPTGNPTGGGFMWYEAGVGFRARGAGGTVTTFAPA